jgi:hypothetical protein
MPVGYDTIEYVTLTLREAGTMPGSYTVDIYATSGGLPTGASLASASVTSSGISSSYGEVTFNFADITVTAGAKYAIVAKQTSTTSISNSTYWGHADGASYSGGASYYSSNSGSSWTALSGDWTFKVYGTLGVVIPTVTTDTATATASTTADVEGNVTDAGGGTVSERGAVYSSTNATPTIGDSKLASGSGTGTFTASLTGLTAGTLYYIRAYATNEVGTGYGDVLTFTTDSVAPTVTSGAVSDLASTTATLAGEVTATGGSTVTERGVCWNTSANPTTANSKATSGTGLGAYTVGATGLSTGTLYHYRAYAINSVGTSYGDDLTFTTKNTVKKWAQSFVAGATGTLTKVSIYCKLASGSFAPLNLSIYSDSAGSPNAILSTPTAKVITNTDYAFVEVTTNQAVTSGTTYWIVINDTYFAGFWHIWLGATSPSAYASGAVKYTLSSAPTSWINTSYTTHDFTFRTNIQPSVTATYALNIKAKRRYK